MALKLFVHDTTTGSCELAGLVPYPSVSTTDPSVTVTPVVDPATGQVDYQLAVEHTVDINVDAFSYDATTKDIILTETDGTVHTINVADLLDNVSSTMTPLVKGSAIAEHDNGEGNVVTIYETVTQIGVTGSSLIYVDENGDKNEVSLCQLISGLDDNGTTVGG